MKGETVDEITGCASAMKRAATQVRPNIGGAMLVDVVGTGGDGTHTFNISTTSAFVVAGSGVKVAKHGNRSVSSRSGAADVLTALGANVQLTAEQSAACIEEVGFTFLFAVAYHPAMRYAIGARRELAARTIFNILGPLTNPASATNLLVGTYDSNLTEPMARVLGQMGVRAAYVVHGADGLDELSITGINKVSHVHGGSVRTFDLDPVDYGFARATLADLKGGDPADNAALTRGILAGKISGPMRDAVLLNAGVALSTETGDFAAGVETARASIESGAALRVLDAFVAKTQSYV
ncbi:MAG: anthranilate phosphoribosyltransferase [Caldilineaceae bacterium]